MTNLRRTRRAILAGAAVLALATGCGTTAGTAAATSTTTSPSVPATIPGICTLDVTPQTAGGDPVQAVYAIWDPVQERFHRAPSGSLAWMDGECPETVEVMIGADRVAPWGRVALDVDWTDDTVTSSTAAGDHPPVEVEHHGQHQMDVTVTVSPWTVAEPASTS